MLEGRLAPERWLELLLRGAREEKDEQNVQRVLRYLTDAWWRLTLPEARAREASRVEETLWGGLRQAGSSTLKASYFRAYQDVVTTPSGLARLRSIWGEDESVPGLVLSEVDYTTMALELAVREVPGWPVILERQEARITNPDRRARFNFLRPSVAADPARRTEFFESLRDPASREEETWVTAGLAYLNHPLRAPGSERFILPALEMVEEIQRTGDIFFPKAWVDATLSGHSSATAAGIVEAFLEGRPDYPDRLRGKILQSADYLFRAARILQGGP